MKNLHISFRCVRIEIILEFIVEEILKLRNANTSIDIIIIDRLMAMDNYKAGLDLLLKSDVNENIICTIGMNRKSRNYDRPYFQLYNELYDVFVNNNNSKIIHLFKATKKINIGKFWRKYLFNTSSERAIEKHPEKHFEYNAF